MPIQPLAYPVSVEALFDVLHDMPWACWLDSGTARADAGQRFHVMVANPRLKLLYDGRHTHVLTRWNDVQGKYEQPPLSVLRSLLKERDAASRPYAGGAFGYLSYDYGRQLQGAEVHQSSQLPLLAFGIYDWALVIDRQAETCVIAGCQGGEWPDSALLHRLEQATQRAADLPPLTVMDQPLHHDSRDHYAQGFGRIQHYLREGDCYQVNYAQRFSLAWSHSPWLWYRYMRRANPAPYGGYLDLGFSQILSSSPEHFLGVERGQVLTRPIKGTRPRHPNAQRDRALGRELLCSVKDRAENLMIVDLLRNDLGRCCKPGSICVPELFRLERQPTVQHLVSSIVGELAADKDAFDLLAACFPGGSITGAPKQRAMQIIDELEGHAREIYCGSFGWIGYDGDMQMNIAIRTLVIRGGEAVYWAGGGIVADSELEQEYRESLHKAKAFFDLLAVPGQEFSI